MNPIIAQHFNTVEARLILSSVIISYRIMRQDIALSDGKLRVRARLSDGGLLELFEYVAESSGHVTLLRYSYHWQDASNKWKRRWDNAPHYPHLPNAPHHVHNQNRSVQAVMTVPDFFFVMAEIEKALSP